MKLHNIVIKMIFWFLVSNGTPKRSIKNFTNGPPNKKIRIYTTEYEQGQGGFSKFNNTQCSVCTSQYSEGLGFPEYPESSYQSANFKTIRDLDTGKVHIVPTGSNTLNIGALKSFECDRWKGQVDDEGLEDPEADPSKEITSYKIFPDQASLNQRTDPYEESQGSVSTEKRPEEFPDPFLIRTYIISKASDTFYLFSEPVLGFKKQIVLANKTSNNSFPKEPIKSFMQRGNTEVYCYLVFLRFKNVRKSFNTRKSARDKGLFQDCKERFPSKLENFQQSEFGNEIILDASFQIIVSKLWINENLDLTFLDRFDFLYSLVFDQDNNEGTKNLEFAWEEYKRPIGFKESLEVVKLVSVNEIRYSGILSKKSISRDNKKKKGKLNAEFMTLESKGGQVRLTGRSVKIKGVNVKFLQIPILKKRKWDDCKLYNYHLEIEVDFEVEKDNRGIVSHHS